jgi:GntR family transcriptional regulator
MQAEPNLSILDNKIQYDLNLPLYYQIMSMIKRGIANGSLQPGDLLPTEEQFCKRFDVSRTTIRQAFAALVKEGSIVRVQGKGTFIAQQQKLDRKMDNIYSFTHEMQSIGLRASSKIIKCEKILPEEDIRQLFAMNPNEYVYQIVRVRLAADQPLLLETTFLPVSIIKYLDGKILESTSLYDLLNEQGIEPFRAQETYESMLIVGEESRLLQCKNNTTGFFIERIAWLKSGQIFEFTQSIMRGDRSKIVINLQQNNCTFNRSVE